MPIDQVLVNTGDLSEITTDIGICNLALLKMGNADNYITAFDDATKEARACKACYSHVLKIVIDEYDWNCCIKKTTLTVNSTAPNHGWDHAYDLPTDFIRILTLADSDTTDDDTLLEWKRENSQILTNSDALYLTYIFYNTDVALYDARFIQAFAARLAIEIQPSVGGRKSLQELWGEYDKIMNDMHLADAKDNYASERGSCEMIYVR